MLKLNNKSRDLALWDNIRDHWNGIGTYFDEIDKAVDQFLLGHGHSLLDGKVNKLNTMNFPKVDVEEFNDRIEVHAELPGMKKDDIQVELEDGTLSIYGKKTIENRLPRDDVKKDNEKVSPIVIERYDGEFKRQFVLPPNILEEPVESSYKDGILKLVFKTKKPEEEKSKVKKINLD